MEVETPAAVRVLVADDERDLLRICADVLTSEPLVGRRPSTVHTVSTGSEARQALHGQRFDLIVLDVQMPGVSGLGLMHFALEHGNGAPVVLITAYPNYRDAVAAVKEGAFDYVVKPFTADQLLTTAKRAIDEGFRTRSPELGSRTSTFCRAIDSILGNSPVIEELRELVLRVAPLKDNVVLMGETGTGKSMVARVIHDASLRRNLPFVTLDCGAIPRDLIESEMFGHERGAFTGAAALRKGMLELAEAGTLFLDEVSEIPLELQSRLLRALHEREFRRVGGAESMRFDARVIAASNRNLDVEVSKGRFRQDLFYRLHVIPIRVPNLREHTEDVQLLAAAFLNGFGTHDAGRTFGGISPEALRILKRYNWPGNVRELENVIRRASVFNPGELIRAADLPDEIRAEVTDSDLIDSHFNLAREHRLSLFEERYFRDLLHRTAGNVVEAARCSGVPRATLYRYLRKHNLDPAHFRVSSMGHLPGDETGD